jgi:Flp pilus assembly protein TadG
LISIAFFLMLFGVMDWGWMFFRRSEFMDAVLDGTRRAVTRSQSDSLDPATAAVQYTEENLTAYGIDPDLTTITAEYSGSSPGEVLIVTATMPYEPLIGLWPTPDTVNAQMSMYLEIQD